MEGKKAYILPGVAALVLLVLLLLRGQAGDTEAPAPEPEAAPAATAPAPSTKARIREAIAAAGDATLDATAQDALRAALAPVIDRCRSSRSATDPIQVTVEAIAAQGIGARVERATVKGSLPADLTGCVREGILGSKVEDIGQTGRLSATLEYPAP
ncbi:MAG: hypothetical protein AAGA54_18015 [Myxococcota bacterium]